MNCTVEINWKTVCALGASIVGIIFGVKMNASDVTEVSIHLIDAFVEPENVVVDD